MKTPWVLISAVYTDPNILGGIGPGCLNQVPTLFLAHRKVEIISPADPELAATHPACKQPPMREPEGKTRGVLEHPEATQELSTILGSRRKSAMIRISLCGSFGLIQTLPSCYPWRGHVYSGLSNRNGSTDRQRWSFRLRR